VEASEPLWCCDFATERFHGSSQKRRKTKKTLEGRIEEEEEEEEEDSSRLAPPLSVNRKRVPLTNFSQIRYWFERASVPRFDSFRAFRHSCRWPLAVPRTEHTAARLSFSARHARVASAATAKVLSVFPLSLYLETHVLRHLLVRCLQKCGKQAPASSAGRFARQLRRDGEAVPDAAARRLSCSCLRCGLPRLRVTCCRADCGVLCERCGGRENAVSVAEDG
jgi:hypothetical protein